MTDINGFPAPRTPEPGRAAERPADPAAAPPEDGASSRGRRFGGMRDPFDLETAFARLKSLLAADGADGPRADAPKRGFYLNILA